jgi:hypothetical protein
VLEFFFPDFPEKFDFEKTAVLTGASAVDAYLKADARFFDRLEISSKNRPVV